MCVVGNLMGQLEDLVMIFELMGSPRDKKYLFLGDYVDKGYFSVEVSDALVIYLKGYHSSFAIKGSLSSQCESSSRTSWKSTNDSSVFCIRLCIRLSHCRYGFYDECITKYNSPLEWSIFCSCFDHLPIAAIINNKVMNFPRIFVDLQQDILCAWRPFSLNKNSGTNYEPW